MPNDSTSIEIEFLCYKIDGEFAVAVCENTTAHDNRIGVWYSNGLQAGKESTTGRTFPISHKDYWFNYKHKVSVSNNIATCVVLPIGHKTETKYITKFPFNPMHSLVIGGLKRLNIQKASFLGRIYYVKIYEDGVLKHKFKPYADDKMIDIVTNTIIENQGTAPTYARYD